MLVGLAYLLARTDEFHLVPLAAVLAIALAAAAAREGRMVLKVALGAGLALIVVHGLDRQLGKLTDATNMAGIDLSAAGGMRTTSDDAHALEELAAAVRARSKPGDPLLSAPPRYDRVRVGDTLLYTLLDRRNPTRYDVVQPGVVTTAKVQREMRSALARTRHEARRPLGGAGGAGGRGQRLREVVGRDAARRLHRRALRAGRALRRLRAAGAALS